MMYEPVDFSGGPRETLDLKDVEDRLKTFETWPNPNMSPQVLANAGFYFIRTADIVRCAFCGVEGFQWLSGDDPLAHHLRWKPDCPFLIGNIRRPSTPEDEPTSVAELACKICYVNKMIMFAKPCQHLFACIRCAFKLTRCAICRRKVDCFERVYVC